VAPTPTPTPSESYFNPDDNARLNAFSEAGGVRITGWLRPALPSDAPVARSTGWLLMPSAALGEGEALFQATDPWLPIALDASDAAALGDQAGEGMLVVVASTDAKPGLIATASHGERYLTLKTIGNTAPAAGKVFELWALPQAGVPRSLGVIPAGGIVRVPLPAPVDESLSNIPSLAVSVEPPGGSPTGQPTGPVLYSGAIERMY